MMRNNDDRVDYDKPPYSRLFIVCSKQHTKEDLLPVFEEYGHVEDIYMPKDRATGLSKGIAFVKYHKTSSAAAAIQELHMKCMQKESKPLKVMVSSNKNEGPNANANEEKFKRLFIKVNRNITENEIRDHFSRFGEIVSVHLQKDKTGSDQCRGFAYVNYNTFVDAAKAFEQCDSKYRAIFATPKEELKRPRISDEYDNYHNNHHNNSQWRDDSFGNFTKHDFDRRETISSMINAKSQNVDTICATCSPAVPQRCLEQLFKIVPGMVNFNFNAEFSDCTAVIKYESEIAAAHAIETLNFYEFPSGEVITVKPMNNPISQVANNLSEIVKSFKNAKDTSPDMLQLAEVIAQASNLIKEHTSKDKDTENGFEYVSGVKLPLIKPLAKGGKVVQRCFLVLKPVPPPQHILQNLFCRFGDLIDVTMFPNKTFGFAKYGSTKAAQEAMSTLHGATLYGVKFKVIEADEKPSKDRITDDDDDGTDHDMETKRVKLDQ